MAFDDDPPSARARDHVAHRPLDKGRRQNGDENTAEAQEAVERQEDATWCERKEEDKPTPPGSTVDEDDDL